MASVYFAVRDEPDAGSSVGMKEVSAWQLRVGDVFAVPGRDLGGPQRVVSVAVLPGMRKLFLAAPDQPLPAGRLTAAQLREAPSCTVGDDVAVQLLPPA